MRKRHRYSTKGVYKISRFAEHVTQNHFRPVSLGLIGGIEWFLRCRKSPAEDKVFPLFVCLNNDPNVEHRVRGFIKIRNHHNSKKRSTEKEGCVDIDHDSAWAGPSLPIREVLDRKNGWLNRNGALILEYGIQVEAIWKNQVWMFNFDDQLFGLDREHNMIGFGNTSRRFWCHKKLILFHNPNFSSIENFSEVPEDLRNVEDLLQITHGVRARWGSSMECGWALMNVIEVAAHFKMWNVTRFCEQQLIHLWISEEWAEDLIDVAFPIVRFAIVHNLSHFLVCLLESDHCGGFKNWPLSQMESETAKGGTMKIIVKKIFDSDL